MIFFNLIVKWIKLDFNKWQTWVLGTWAFQQCSPESCIILWPLCPALHTLFHAWRDFGLAFDWRTWLVVCPSSCRHAPAFSALLISCHTLPLFTQTHQRQRRIQIVLMDFSSNIPNPYTDIKLTQCILEQEQNSIENKKKKRKKGWGEMIKKWVVWVWHNICILRNFYWRLPSCLSDWVGSVFCCLICKPICYIVHVSQRIVDYQMPGGYGFDFIWFGDIGFGFGWELSPMFAQLFIVIGFFSTCFYDFFADWKFVWQLLW